MQNNLAIYFNMLPRTCQHFFYNKSIINLDCGNWPKSRVPFDCFQYFIGLQFSFIRKVWAELNCKSALLLY